MPELIQPTFTNLLHISRAALQARLQDLDIISNDLANINTTGYKSVRGNFQELLNDSLKNSGVKLTSTQRIMTQGNMQDSSSPYHLAIQGEGFFAVTLPNDEIAYTRDGRFGLDAKRQLVNADGYPLVWKGQLPADADAVEIQSDGRVMARVNGEWSQVGTVQLYRFANPTGLTAYGSNLFLESDASGEAEAGNPGTETFGQIVSYMLEASNVDIAEELTNMIITQRSFQMALRAFQQTDTMLNLAINLRR